MDGGSTGYACECGQVTGWPEFFGRSKDGVVHTFRCPACAAPTEYVIRASGITVGHTYAAGTLHFAGVTDVEIPEIQALLSARHRAR